MLHYSIKYSIVIERIMNTKLLEHNIMGKMVTRNHDCNMSNAVQNVEKCRGNEE